MFKKGFTGFAILGVISITTFVVVGFGLRGSGADEKNVNIIEPAAMFVTVTVAEVMAKVNSKEGCSSCYLNGLVKRQSTIIAMFAQSQALGEIEVSWDQVVEDARARKAKDNLSVAYSPAAVPISDALCDPCSSEICETYDDEHPSSWHNDSYISDFAKCPSGYYRDVALLGECIIDFRDTMCELLCDWRAGMCDGDEGATATYDSGVVTARSTFYDCADESCLVNP